MNFYARSQHTILLSVATLTAVALCFSASADAQAAISVAAAPSIAAATAPSAFSLLAAASSSSAFAVTSSESSPSSSSPDELPDAPGTALHAYAPAADQPTTGANPAPKYAKYIPSDESAQHITGRDKVIIGFRDLYSPYTLGGEVISAGYSHITDGAPNYGVNSTAFAQRLGASVARNTAEGIFTDAVFSPMLHMDPRYYVQGPDHNFFGRAVYAATRVLISKTDSGRNTINAPLLLGYAGAAALNNVYYPPINRNFKDTSLEFGGSLGGAALGFVVEEFSDQLLKAVHMRSR